MFSYYEDYGYSEAQHPEIDDLITETIDKIKETIMLEIKDEIDNQLHKAEIKQEEIDRLNESLRDRNKLIDDLRNQVKLLQADIDKKRTEIPTFEYELDEEVWVAKSVEIEELVCSTCNGKGRIEISTEDYGNLKINCPTCECRTYFSKGKNMQEVVYDRYAPQKYLIKGINIQYSSDGISVRYAIENRGFVDSKEVFKTKEECIRYCDVLNTECLYKAERRLKGIEDIN